MKTLRNKVGMTIKELKDLVKDLPEVDENGENYEVWVENCEYRGLSNPVRTITRLNKGDILLSRWTYENIRSYADYEKLLLSGMFWEEYPELSGVWEEDRRVINSK